MTISSTTVKNSYNGDGSTTTFSYTFKVFADSDLQVIIRSALGTETVKTLTTHYTVTGAGDASGGSVIFTGGNIPVATETVVLRRAIPQTQAIDYIANDPFPAESHEEGLDRATMAIQQLQEELNRSIKISRTNTMTSTEFTVGSTARAGKILGFDDNGELVVSQELGTYAGNWTAGETYAARDIVKDTSNNNIYLCNTGHTASGTTPISSNADVAKWDLLVDAYSATASAAAASASASAASSSETNAASSASAASTSASNASTSETNASNSASAASTSETNAAASYDSFDDRYLGPKATDPSVDNDGDALIDGALYFDTTLNVMKVYDLGTTSWKRTTPTSTQQTAIDNVDGISADVTTVAGQISPTNNISTLAGINADITTVANNETDIQALADLEDGTTATGALSTLAGLDTELEAVYNIRTNITNVDTNSANVNLLASQISPTNNIATLGALNSQLTNLGALGTEITNLNNIRTDITGVNNINSQVQTVAGLNTEITNLDSISADITAVANISGDIQDVQDKIAELQTVANDLNEATSEIETVAGSIANVNLVGGSIANVNEVANNIGTVNNFGDRYRVQAGEPSVDNDEGDLVYDTTANAVKVYNGTSFDTIQQGITDTAPTRHSIRPSLNLDFANSKVLDPRITFTRASNATYYDGYTSVKAEENLATQSQSFTGWTNFNSTDTQNTVAAPDGTTTATTLNEGSTTNYHAFYLGVTGLVSTGITYTLSFFAKENTGRYVNLAINNTVAGTGQYAAASYDLQLGTVSDTGQSGSGYAVTNTSITSVGNGWYRCVLTGTFGSSISAPRIYIANGNTGVVAGYGIESYTGTNRDIYIWGAQLEQRDTVTAYTPTTTQPITNYVSALQTAGNNVARFDHNPTTGESLGLLIEESRTNLSTYSEDLDNWYDNKVNSSVESNVNIAPDGTLTADRVIKNSGSNNVVVGKNFTTTIGIQYVASVYVKKYQSSSTLKYFGLTQVANDTTTAWFNLDTATVGTVVGTNASATITDVGNDWYRATYTWEETVGGSRTFYHRISAADNNPTSTGNGYDGYLVWGFQIEVGAFPTSYIKTTGSQVTRSVDSTTMTGTNFSDWYNQKQGTILTDFTLNHSPTLDFNPTIWVLYEGVFNIADNMQLSFNGTTGRLRLGSYDSSGNDYNGSSPIYPSNVFSAGRIKTVSSFSNDGAGFAYNGNIDTTGTFSMRSVPKTELLIGISGNASTRELNGHIKKFSYYPLKLTNNEITDLSEE